ICVPLTFQSPTTHSFETVGFELLSGAASGDELSGDPSGGWNTNASGGFWLLLWLSPHAAAAARSTRGSLRIGKAASYTRSVPIASYSSHAECRRGSTLI